MYGRKITPRVKVIEDLNDHIGDIFPISISPTGRGKLLYCEGDKAYYDDRDWEKNKIETYDKFNQDLSTVSSLGDLILVSDILFICLPTPMQQDGSCDTSIVVQTILEIDKITTDNEYDDKIIVIKSTVPPGTTKMLQEKTSSSVNVVFNPEFLTEANHIEDFKNQKRIVLGGDNCKKSLEKIKAMYMKQFPEVPYVMCGSLEAEITKYFCNCYLATKVSFANEMRQLCDSLNADYDRIVSYT